MRLTWFKNIGCWFWIGLLLPVSMAFADAGRLSVVVSIPPQAYFVKKIGGDFVSVMVMVPPGESPATFSPTPAEMSRFLKARLFFRIGVPFENTMIPKIKNMAADIEIIDTRQGITLRRMTSVLADHTDEDHYHDGQGHDVGGYDPHIWMSPLLVKQQAQTMAKALCRADADHCDAYQANCQIFLKELDALHRDLKMALAPVKGEKMFVFHPAFGYLADTYGLKQVAVQVEGKSPKGRKLSQFIENARQNNVRVIFVQPQFDKHTARKIARMIGGVVVPLNPLAEDYINNFQQMAGEIKRALADEPAR